MNADMEVYVVVCTVEKCKATWRRVRGGSRNTRVMINGVKKYILEKVERDAER